MNVYVYKFLIHMVCVSTPLWLSIHTHQYFCPIHIYTYTFTYYSSNTCLSLYYATTRQGLTKSFFLTCHGPQCVILLLAFNPSVESNSICLSVGLIKKKQKMKNFTSFFHFCMIVSPFSFYYSCVLFFFKLQLKKVEYFCSPSKKRKKTRFSSLNYIKFLLSHPPL